MVSEVLVIWTGEWVKRYCGLAGSDGRAGLRRRLSASVTEDPYLYQESLPYHYDVDTGGGLAQPGKQARLKETLSVDSLRTL